jgi:hypothetical protein
MISNRILGATVPFVGGRGLKIFVVPVAPQAVMGSLDFVRLSPHFVQDDKRGLVNGFPFRASLGLGCCKK